MFVLSLMCLCSNDKMRVIAQDTLVEGTAAWGVQVERVEVRDTS